jgi:hypothetical protein
MKKTLLSIILLFSIWCGLKAPPNRLNLYSEEAKFAPIFPEWYITSTSILEAMIYVESRGNPNAYNKKEKAAGILQIRPITVREVNRILRHSSSRGRYTLKNRYDPVKSIEMWRIIMDKHNPGYDLKTACRVWNGRKKNGMGSTKYYNLVKANLNRDQL